MNSNKMEYNKKKEMEKIIETPRIGKLIKKNHENKWVAFSADYKKIVDYSESLEKLQKKIGESKVIYYKVFPLNVVIAP